PPPTNAPDLGFRSRRFQSLSFRLKRQSIYEGKRDFSQSASRSRPASKNLVILAQNLAHKWSRLRLVRSLDFSTVAIENVVIGRGLGQRQKHNVVVCRTSRPFA